jgi:uncharacterized protein
MRYSASSASFASVNSKNFSRLAQALFCISALAMVLVLPGCATYSAGFVRVENAAAKRDLDGALKSLDELKLTGSDEALLYLNKGTLLRLQGKYADSNMQFESAKSLMEKLNAISIKEQAASVSINDTFKAYECLPSEQLMVYSFEALNYLQMGAVDDAAVEARQFDVKQGLIAKKNKGAKYLSGAFVRYLNGMVYEAAGETDSARIEMQKAVAAYKEQNPGFPVPKKLTADLARLEADKAAPSEVVFVLHNGLGPSLNENNIRVPNPGYDPRNPKSISMFSLAVPKLVKRPLPVDHVVLNSDSVSETSEVVEDVNGIAEKSFNDRLPAIIARGVARLAVKKTAEVETNKRNEGNPMVSIFTSVVSNVSERADTRTWSLLPGNIQMARMVLPAGKHDVTATYYSANGSVIGTREFKDIAVKPGQKSFVSDYFFYPPSPPRAAN